ncbi:MAG: gliding motility lipoprotein GldH [Muribaculaceae bacterium]|nr:gliding motility lipoprotein GldH [Muribaculaceae bacterium]
MTHNSSILQSILRSAGSRLYGWIAISFLICGCANITPVEYSEFDYFGREGIPSGWMRDFSPVPADSANFNRRMYDVILTVRYNSRCSSRNIILDIEEFSLSNSEPDSLRIDMPLFYPDGRPLGIGNLGLYEISDTLRRDIPIQEGYTISVSTPLSSKETSGINAIGIRLSGSGETTPLYIKNFFN